MEMRDHQDHAYTSVDKSCLADLTYKMSYKEVEDFVKLRVSNSFLFSGKRNTSMWAWRAILKYMGLQHRMSHYQASKKWENMKKKYKDLKNAPDGVKGFPETWPYFSLMEDALEGRLQGKAPILKVLPSDSSSDDFLPFSRSKRKKLPTAEVSPARDSGACWAEIEVSVDRDDDRKEVVITEGNNDLDFSIPEVDEEKIGKDSEVMLMQRERMLMQRERAVLDRERAVLNRERAVLNRERAVLNRERAVLEKETLVMEREKLVMEREKLVMEREKLVMEKDRDTLRSGWLALEKESEAGEAVWTKREERGGCRRRQLCH